ncbi:MAG: hypothetical protein QXV17_08920 [Candidatus Micrarchaeaceae archaeon]
MTEDVFKAKVEEYRKEWPGKEYKYRTESWAMADLLQDMQDDLRKLSSEGFIEKYSWIERLMFEKPLKPVEDRGDNVLNNIERYDYYRIFHYDTGYIYFTGPTFICFLFNFIKETERIKKESERREKLINNILYRRNETSDKINRIHEYIQDSYKDDKTDEITAVLNYIKTAINNLFNDTIDMSNLLIENNDRLDHIEKIVASIAPVIEHITRKIDRTHARVADLDEEEHKFLNKVDDISMKIDAKLPALEKEVVELKSKVDDNVGKETENNLSSNNNNTTNNVDAKVETKARKTNLLDKIIRIVKKEAL